MLVTRSLHSRSFGRVHTSRFYAYSNLKPFCLPLATGPIPPVLGKLGALEQLMLWGNKLSGEHFNRFHQKQIFSFQIVGPANGVGEIHGELIGGNNSPFAVCTGYIPEALGNLSMLKVLRLDDNRLTGKKHALSSTIC